MSKQEYKTLAIKSLKFIVIILAVDLVMGTLLRQVFFSQETGKYSRITHSVKDANAEILIMGSSHANRHYVPDVFERELEQTADNCGVLGQELIFHAALQKMMLKRTKPKMIILNVDKTWLYESEKAIDGLRDLYPYYWQHRDVLRPFFMMDSKFIDFRMIFSAYQFNSTIIHAIKYYFDPQISFKGYVPSYKKMEVPADSFQNRVVIPRERKEGLDENFISILKNFISTARLKNIELVFAVSPNVYETDYSKNISFSKIIAIADECNVPLFNYSNDIRFLSNFDMFTDRSHLNDKGANLFSKILSEDIKKAEIISNKKWARQK